MQINRAVSVNCTFWKYFSLLLSIGGFTINLHKDDSRIKSFQQKISRNFGNAQADFYLFLRSKTFDFSSVSNFCKLCCLTLFFKNLIELRKNMGCYCSPLGTCWPCRSSTIKNKISSSNENGNSGGKNSTKSTSYQIINCHRCYLFVCTKHNCK